MVGPGASVARAAPLTVEEAVARVAHAHPDVLAARAAASAAAAAAASDRGHLLPAFHVSDKQFWTLAKMSGSGFVGPLLTASGVPLGAAGSTSDFSINLLQIGAAQPTLGLIKGAYAYSATRRRASAAHLGAQRQQEVTQAQVRAGYLQLSRRGRWPWRRLRLTATCRSRPTSPRKRSRPAASRRPTCCGCAWPPPRPCSR